MNKKLFLYLIFIMLLTSGCLTTSSLVKTLEQNPSLTPYEADKKFGNPYKVESYMLPLENIRKIRGLYRTKTGEPKVVLKTYAPLFADRQDYITIVFIDDRIFRHGKDDPFFHLQLQKDLGLITEDEYRWKYQQAAQAMGAYYNAQIQMLQQWQNTQYQNQVLSNQRKLIELEKQKANSIQYNPPQIIGRQSTTDCYTDNQGNIHCTTNQH